MGGGGGDVCIPPPQATAIEISAIADRTSTADFKCIASPEVLSMHYGINIMAGIV